MECITCLLLSVYLHVFSGSVLIFWINNHDGFSYMTKVSGHQQLIIFALRDVLYFAYFEFLYGNVRVCKSKYS